ncbi:hypothetical protein QTP88_009650 [Uroleucon formosanum]
MDRQQTSVDGGGHWVVGGSSATVITTALGQSALDLNALTYMYVNTVLVRNRGQRANTVNGGEFLINDGNGDFIRLQLILLLRRPRLLECWSSSISSSSSSSSSNNSSSIALCLEEEKEEEEEEEGNVVKDLLCQRAVVD